MPDVSPIGSPVKTMISTSTSLSPMKNTSEWGKKTSASNGKTALCSSTPNKKALASGNRNKSLSRGLSARDTNSPLALVQRKQVAKVNSQILSRDNGSCVVDKENMLQ